MPSFKILSQSQKQTITIGKKLAGFLKPGDIICLSGDLGSGKTTLVKGIAAGLGIKSTEVNSPTFVLMNSYDGRMPLFHFDLYRLENEKQILMLDYEEYFYGEGVAVVEWAERLGKLFPPNAIKIELQHSGEEKRLIKIYAADINNQKLLAKLKLDL